MTRSDDQRIADILDAYDEVSEDAVTAHPDVDWRSISRLPIVLAHHHHRNDPDLIWSYAVEQAPFLAAALRD